MADITTLSSANRHVATEILAANAQEANRASYMRMQSLCHYDTSLDGANSTLRKIFKNADLGAASAGAEATDPGTLPTVELDNGVPATASATMGVKEVAEISEDDVSTQLSLTSSQTQDLFHGFSVFTQAQWTSVLGKYIRQLAPMAYRKQEADALALQSTLSNSVGLGTDLVTLVTLVSAMFQHRKQKPLLGAGFGRFVLNTNMIERLTKEAMFSNGGVGGQLWGENQFSLMNIPDGVMQGNGLYGSFLKRPVHEIEEDMKVTASTVQHASYGNHGVPGVSASADSSGKCGAFEIAHKTPLSFRAQADASKCTIEVTMVARYIPWEVSDAEATLILAKDEA